MAGNKGKPGQSPRPTPIRPDERRIPAQDSPPKPPKPKPEDMSPTKRSE